MSSVKWEQAQAIRRVNAAYSRLENPKSTDIFTDEWVRLEHDIDAHVAAGDDQKAIKAIKAWRDHALRELNKLAEATQ